VTETEGGPEVGAAPGADEKLWGGRFRAPLDPRVRAFTGSLHFDRRLARHDLVGSLAHARMLLETGILAREEADSLLRGLSGLLRDLEEGRVVVEGEDEDVHTWIERALRERIGRTAGRLHAARSRNDQTGAALRLLVRAELEEVLGELIGPVEAWVAAAAEHAGSWMPAYTHLQRAQPVSLGHHLLAHAWQLLADADRLRATHRGAGRSPLGAGAAAGSSLPIDPERTAELLGFEGTYPNSLHAVSDRDYVAETLFACALVMVHLSRWAEEVVLWSSREFAFAELPDSVAQGSSLMPQKKNPEAVELLRGKSGRTLGDLVALLTVLKGLPLAYNSDLQEDKEPLFDTLDTTRGSLSCAGLVATRIRYRTDRMAAALEEGHVTATRLAELLVERGVPFREAHEAVGRAVLAAEERSCPLWELPEGILGESIPGGETVDREELRPERAVGRSRSSGGPAPDRVRAQVEGVRGRLREIEGWLDDRDDPPILRAHRAGTLTSDALEP